MTTLAQQFAEINRGLSTMEKIEPAQIQEDIASQLQNCVDCEAITVLAEAVRTNAQAIIAIAAIFRAK